MELLQCLLLLLVANGSPIILRQLLGERFSCPIDGGKTFIDGKPLIGESKTARGIVFSILITAITAEIMGLSYITGLSIGAFAMLGDLLSSFVKRRLDIKPSGMVLGLDQIPESLFPVMAVRSTFHFDWSEVLMLVVAFAIIELMLSRLLYKLHIRKHPY